MVCLWTRYLSPAQPPRQTALCHALRCLLQLEEDGGSVASALSKPVHALSQAAMRAQGCEYLGASGVEPLAVHSADVFWSLLLLHCCVAPSDTAPSSDGHRPNSIETHGDSEAAVALLGETGGSLFSSHCLGAAAD